MKKIIFRKIALDCLKFFLLCIISVSLIIWVLQAVNYLDFVIEDGHGFLVYLKYTLLSFPKILSKIFPFAVIFSTIYILLKYEDKNELMILWNFGIGKIKFVNFFLKLSLIFLIANLLLNSLLVPYTLDKSRSYIRTSNLDFFESILKPKKFIDVVNDLTIFFDEKTDDGELKNILLKHNTKNGGYQVTYAKIGKFVLKGNNKNLVLYNGRTLTKQKEVLSEFRFSKTDFSLANFSTNIISKTKTQENSTKELLGCILLLEKIRNIEKDFDKSFSFYNCRVKNLKNIYKELYKRLIIPFYNILLIMIPLFIILKSKEDNSFILNKFKVFIISFIFIIFLEASSNFILSSFKENIWMILLPFVLYLMTHIYLIKKLRIYKS